MAATYDQAADAYLDNADFEEASSLTKAKAFVTACIRLMVLLPSSASHSSTAQSFDMGQIAAAKDRALAYIAANQQGASVRFLNAGNYRG